MGHQQCPVIILCLHMKHVFSCFISYVQGFYLLLLFVLLQTPTRAEVSPNSGLLSWPLVPYVLVVKSSIAGSADTHSALTARLSAALPPGKTGPVLHASQLASGYSVREAISVNRLMRSLRWVTLPTRQVTCEAQKRRSCNTGNALKRKTHNHTTHSLTTPGFMQHPALILKPFKNPVFHYVSLLILLGSKQ